MVTLETGVKVPVKKRAPNVNVKYPFAEMSVGQSFFEACTRTQEKGVRAKLRQAATVFTKKMHFAVGFTTRIVDGGVRVWRMS